MWLPPHGTSSYCVLNSSTYNRWLSPVSPQLLLPPVVYVRNESTARASGQVHQAGVQTTRSTQPQSEPLDPEPFLM